MILSRVTSLLAVAAIACAAIASRSWVRITEACVAIAHGVQAFAEHVVNVLAPTQAAERAPTVRFVQARAFVARILRRKHIQLTDSWRMCPSA